MNIDFANLSPVVAVIAVAVLAVLDLLSGFSLALKAHETSWQKLPSWLYTVVLPYVVPTIGFYLPQALAPNGAVDSKLFAGLVYTAAITCGPKIAQDVVRKITELVTGTPAAIAPITPLPPAA